MAGFNPDVHGGEDGRRHRQQGAQGKRVARQPRRVVAKGAHQGMTFAQGAQANPDVRAFQQPTQAAHEYGQCGDRDKVRAAR